ncbi:MAG: ABC transporter substrate-binding protein [Nitrospirae bacterium]|nr:ABC transporter substrate-binding protein [Nitrospirota bacterium]
MGRLPFPARGRSLLPLFFACLTALGGCTGNGRPAADSGAGTVVVAIEATPTNLDPRLATDAYSERIGQLLFHKLVRVGPNLEVVPDLATAWEIPNPTTYRFTLKQGVTFHDGTPLTAADVVYTFNWIRDPANGSPHRAAYGQIARVVAEDDHTVRFDLTAPHAPFLVNMVRGIVPAHGGDDPAYALNPVGSGPFRLVENRPGERITLAAFDGYVGGRPPSDRIVFRILPEDTVRMLALKKGDVHMVLNALPPDAVDLLAREPHLVAERGPGTNYSYLGFNLEDPVLKVPAVRQAIAHAIDRQAIIDAIYQGQARPAKGLLTPEHWAYNGAVTTYAYDPGRARALLDGAGFPDPDGEAPRLALTYKTSQNELTRRIGEVLQQQLAQVGIQVTVRAYEWGTFYADIKKGNFQLFTLSWVGITDPDIFYDVFHSASVPPDGANRGRYRDERVDALLAAARATPERVERARLYGSVQAIVADTLPYVPLWHPDAVLVRDRRLTGFELTPTGDYTSLARARLNPS